MKKSVIIFIVLSSILSLSSCGTQSKRLAKVTTSTPEIETSDTKSSENPAASEPENISKVAYNSGNCAIQGEKIYYINSSDNGTLYSMNIKGGDNRKLTKEWTPWFYVSGDRIYYQNGIDGMKICAMNADGSGEQTLNDDDSGNINVIGDKIYYSNNDDNSAIYSMNTDGSDRKKLAGDIPLYMSVAGDRIYYTINGANIYSMNMDGSDKQLLMDSTSNANKNVTYEINARLRKDMPEYRFVATGITQKGDGAAGYVMGLKVYDENDRSLLSADFSRTVDNQVVGNDIYTEMMDTMGLHVSDVNFDGYKDVIILNSFGGAHSNTWYDCWLWNPETSSFVKSESFTGICNPALNPEKKYIYSTGGSGAGSQEWDIYQFIDGEFIITNRLSCEMKNDDYHFAELKNANGKMELVRDDTIQEDSFDHALSAAGYINDNLWQLDNPWWYGVGGHQADPWLE